MAKKSGVLTVYILILVWVALLSEGVVQNGILGWNIPTRHPNSTTPSDIVEDLQSSYSTLPPEGLSTNESQSIVVAPETNKKMEELALDFYRRKTSAVLEFLNGIIPPMRELKTNMSALLANKHSTKSQRMTLAGFKKADQVLDETLDDIEGQVALNHVVRGKFAQLLLQAENQFQTFQTSFTKLLNPDLEATNEETHPCGGLIPISKMLTFNYSRNSTNSKSKSSSSEETCIWLVTNGNSGIVEFNGKVSKLEGLGDGAVLTIFKNLHLQQNSYDGRTITKTDINRWSIISSSCYLIVVFSTMSARGTPGFAMDFSTVSTGGKSTLSKMIPADTTTKQGSFIYQVDSGSRFPNNERAFLSIFPASNKRVNLTINSVDLMVKNDHLSVYEYSRNSKKFQVLQRFNDTTSWDNQSMPSAVGSPGQPILLLLSAYQREVGSQFTATYRRDA